MSEEKNRLNLIQKIAKVQADIPTEIKKEGYNKFQDYHYVTEAQIKQLIRQPLAMQGVIIIPKYEITKEWSENGKKGGVNHYTSVLGTFELTDGDTSVFGSMPGTGMDSGEKSIYKAETGAQKNYLMQLFMVSTGDDPERDDTPANQNKNQYQNNNNYRGNNNRSNYQNNSNNRKSNYQNNRQNNQSNTKINNQMFDQVRSKIRETAGIWNISTDDVSVTLKKKFSYTDLNQITNVVASQIVGYLNNAIKEAKTKQTVGG
jgi:ERF superfamily.